MNNKAIECLGDNGVCIPVSTHSVKSVKKHTRADVIRSMNDEELAEFLLSVNTSHEDSCVTNCKWEDYPTHDKGCKDCFLEYLRKEAE